MVPSRRLRRQMGRGVVYCHSSGGGAAQLQTADSRAEHDLLAAIADSGFPIIAPDLGGPSHTWGNDLAVQRIGQARAYLQGRWGAAPGPVFLLGVSMGALDMLNYARHQRTSVAGLVAILPVTDLDQLRALGADDLQTNIDRAWGVAYPDPLPPAANPARHTEELRGVPYLAFYASDDPLLPGPSVSGFAAAVGGRAIDLGHFGHTQALIGEVPVPEVVAFLRQNC